MSFGYKGTVSSAVGNLLAGRMAWSGNSNGYITTVAKLGSNVLRQTIKLRFRMGSDADVGAGGWWIDSLSVTDTGCFLQSAVSRKSHAGAGSFDINLPLVALGGAVGIECRSGQPAAGQHQIVAIFSHPVTVGSVSVTSGTGAATFSTLGSVVTINLTGVTNAQRLGVTLSDVTVFIFSIGDITIPMGVLAGDANGSGAVNGTDVSQAKLQSGRPVASGSFRNDVIANGAINGTDVASVKASSGTALPP